MSERLNTKTAAYRLGVTVKKVREMARHGVIPAHKTGALIGYTRGRDWVFNSKDVEDYMNGARDRDIRAIKEAVARGELEVKLGGKRIKFGSFPAMFAAIDALDKRNNPDRPSLLDVEESITVGGTICKPASVIDLATRLLPFDGVDEHRIWPLAVYKVEESDEPECVDVCVFSIEGRVVMASGTYGTRAQAIEACRNDLRLRLAAVDELREGCK